MDREQENRRLAEWLAIPVVHDWRVPMMDGHRSYTKIKCEACNMEYVENDRLRDGRQPLWRDVPQSKLDERCPKSEVPDFFTSEAAAALLMEKMLDLDYQFVICRSQIVVWSPRDEGHEGTRYIVIEAFHCPPVPNCKPMLETIAMAALSLIDAQEKSK